MIIKNTPWEKRNFGCESFEITITKDDLKDIDAVICEIQSNKNLENAYVVAKVPAANLEIVHRLQKEGFYFMETQFDIIRKTSEPAAEYLNKLFGSFDVEYLPKEKQLWDEVIELITPDLFTTDRIYLDYMLSENTSSLRYKNWINDLFTNPNAWLAVIKKDNKPYMFNCCINDEEKRSIDYLLAGVFPKYKNSGLGAILPMPTIKYALDNKYKTIETSISSNNAAILKLYEYYNFETTDIKYVLRRYK